IHIGFAVTVPFSQCRQLLLVFFQPWKMLFLQLFKLFLGRLCCFFEFFVQRGKSVPELIALNRSGCFGPAQCRLVRSYMWFTVPEPRLYSMIQFGSLLLNRTLPDKSVTACRRFALRTHYVLDPHAHLAQSAQQTHNFGKK